MGEFELRCKINEERRANRARRSSRWILPRPPLLEDFTEEKEGLLFVKAKPSGVGCAAGLRGFAADAFFGASPVVASALGVHARRDPGVTKMNIAWVVRLTTQNRNFLLCSEQEVSILP
jgi:hypothetical protein